MSVLQEQEKDELRLALEGPMDRQRVGHGSSLGSLESLEMEVFITGQQGKNMGKIPCRFWRSVSSTGPCGDAHGNFAAGKSWEVVVIFLLQGANFKKSKSSNVQAAVLKYQYERKFYVMN